MLFPISSAESSDGIKTTNTRTNEKIQLQFYLE